MIDEAVGDRVRLLLPQPSVSCTGEEAIHVEHVDRGVARVALERERIRHAENPDGAVQLRRVEALPYLARNQPSIELVAVNQRGDADRGAGVCTLHDVDREGEGKARGERGDGHRAARTTGNVRHVTVGVSGLCG